MRAFLAMLWAMAILVGFAAQPAGAGSATDIDRFQKQIQKFMRHQTEHSDPKAKGICVCQDGGPVHGNAGVLGYSGGVGDTVVIVQCNVRVFDLNGASFGASVCDTFEVISK